MTLETIIIHQQDHEMLPHHRKLMKSKINVYPQRYFKEDINGEGPSIQALICVVVCAFPGSTQGKVTLPCLAVASCLMQKVRWKITPVLNIRSSRQIVLRPIHHHRDTRGYCVLRALLGWVCVDILQSSSSTCFATRAWLVWMCFLGNLTYCTDTPAGTVFQWIPAWWSIHHDLCNSCTGEDMDKLISLGRPTPPPPPPNIHTHTNMHCPATKPSQPSDGVMVTLKQHVWMWLLASANNKKHA